MAGESLTILGGFETEADKASALYQEWVRLHGLKINAINQWQEVESYRYATDTHDLPHASAFTHTTHLPLLATIGQDLKAILGQVVLPHEDWFTFEPADTQAARLEQRTAIVSYLKNRHSLSGFKQIIGKLENDLISYGNCFSQVLYVDESDAKGRGYVGPKPFRISPYDIVFNPTAPDFNSTFKFIREVISLGEFHQRGEKGIFNNNAVQRLLEERRNPSLGIGEDKNSQYVPAGFGTYQDYLQGGAVELQWFYGSVYSGEDNTFHNNRMIVVADKSVVLIDEEIKTATGNPHIFQSTWEDKPDTLWAMGPLANIVGINYQMNHRENAKSEALDRLIYPDQVHRGEIEEIYDEETDTSKFISEDVRGGIDELTINTQFFQFDLQIDRLQHAGRQAARLPSDLTGFRSQGEKTLGEVTALTDGGMRGFIDKAASFEETTLEPILAAEIELALDNFGTAFKVPTKTDNGLTTMLEITKESLQINGVLIPKGAKRFARKNQILANLTQLSQTPLMQIAAPHISAKATSTFLGELLELEDTGIFEQDAQVTEAAEQQGLLDQAETDSIIESGNVSVKEEMLNQDIEDLDE